MTARGRTGASNPRRAVDPVRARPVVLKLGGELLETPQRIAAIGSAIAALRGRSPLLVVHGGGKDIDAALARAGIARRQVDGLRITDDATLEIVMSVLAGLVNTRLVAAVSAAGLLRGPQRGRAASARVRRRGPRRRVGISVGVGLTGADAAIGLVEKAAPHIATDGSTVDLGQVGIPVGTEPPQLLIELCRRGYIPIVATIGMSRRGELYNVNADTFAAHLAGALGAQRLVIAGGTAGVLDERGQTLATIDAAAIDRLIGEGTATAGMVAKLSACRDALAHGVREVFIANGHDLAGISELVRHGSRAGVAGCTALTRVPSPLRSQRGIDFLARRSRSFVKKDVSVASWPGP
jgi:acetylglutamate kinase